MRLIEDMRARVTWHAWPVRCAQAWAQPPMTTDREQVNCPDCRRALDAEREKHRG